MENTKKITAQQYHQILNTELHYTDYVCNFYVRIRDEDNFEIYKKMKIWVYVLLCIPFNLINFMDIAFHEGIKYVDFVPIPYNITHLCSYWDTKHSHPYRNAKKIIEGD